MNYYLAIALDIMYYNFTGIQKNLIRATNKLFQIVKLSGDQYNVMEKTLKKINSLVELGIIRNYAIGGGMGQIYYIEPTVTYDLDVMVHLNTIKENDLDPLRLIFDWAKENNYKDVNEYIMIEGMPVQFLPSYNDLVSEAIDNANKVEMFNTETFVIKPEYLMAIMVETGRNKDKIRLATFLEQYKYDKALFEVILKKYNLTSKFDDYKAKFQ